MHSPDSVETRPLIAEVTVKIRTYPGLGNGLRNPWRSTRTIRALAYDPSLTRWIRTKEGRLRLTALDARP